MRVAGADVWKGRWVVVVLSGGRFHRGFVAPSFAAVLAALPDASVVGVDMPIGLPPTGERRRADQLAREYVGPRGRSVFPTPSLEMLEAPSLAQANRLAASRDAPGVSSQAYNLRRHILEVHALAGQDGRVHEVHPEVSFVRANHGGQLPSKASWNGLNVRRAILAQSGIVLPDRLDSEAGSAGCADVLDASIVAWSADRIASGVGERLPPGKARIGAIWS